MAWLTLGFKFFVKFLQAKFKGALLPLPQKFVGP